MGAASFAQALGGAAAAGGAAASGAGAGIGKKISKDPEAPRAKAAAEKAQADAQAAMGRRYPMKPSGE